MTKTEIRRALERCAGGPFIKASELARYLKDSNPSRVRQKYLKDCEYLPGKLYLCEEVAEILHDQKKIGW